LVGSRSVNKLIEIPASISIVNLEQLEDINADNLGEAVLAATSSVTVNQVGQDDFNIRGFRANTPMRDGMIKVGDRPFPIYDVERIEIIKGPAAMLVGANTGLGGTINIIPRPPSPQRTGEVEASVSTHDRIRFAANLTGPLKQSNDFSLDYRLTLGGEYGNYSNQLWHYDDNFVGLGLLMHFGPNSSLQVDAYYDHDWNYVYWNAFLDLATANATGIARLNQYSTPQFDTTYRNSNNVFQHYGDNDIVATYLAKVTQNGNLRIAYGGSLSHDNRRLIQPTNIEANNYTLDRTETVQQIDFRSNNLESDYMHHLALAWLNLDTMCGADGYWTFNGTSASTNTLPALDTRFPGVYPNDLAYYAAPHPGAGQPAANVTATTAYDVSYYGQETVHLWNDRIILSGGLREFVPGGTVETFPSSAKPAPTFTKSLDKNFLVHKAGAVVRLVPGLSAYYSDAQNITLQSGPTDLFAQNDQLGPPLQNSKGQDTEYGLKLDHTFPNGVALFGKAPISTCTIPTSRSSAHWATAT